MRAQAFLSAFLLVLLLGACSPAQDDAGQASASVASPDRLQAGLDRLKAEGPLPSAREASILEYWLHYKLMQATGMEQELGGEEQALATLKAIGMAFERSAVGAQADMPRLLPVAFNGSGMDAGVMGVGHGLVGGAMASGIVSGAVSPERLAEMARNGPIKLDGKDGSLQLDIGENGQVDTTVEQTVNENGVTGKVKTRIHMDSCPDPQGKLVVTLETESQMGTGGASGHVKAKFKYERWLDDDAHLISHDDGGSAQDLQVEVGGTGARGKNLSANMTRNIARGASDYTGSVVEEHGHSIFRPDEAAHTEKLVGDVQKMMQTMAEAMLLGFMNGGSSPWESGRCVDLKVRSTPEKRKGAKPDTTYTVYAEPRAKMDGMPTGGTVKATLKGANTLNPQGKVKADAQFDYRNPPEKDKSATIEFEARSKRGVGKATAEFDTKKGGYRIAATGDSECAEPIVVCDITKPFTNTLCGGTVTWTHTPTGDKGGDFTFRYAKGKGNAEAKGPYALNGPEEEMTSIYTMGRICGHAAGMTACAPPRVFGAMKWTRIDNCEE